MNLFEKLIFCLLILTDCQYSIFSNHLGFFLVVRHKNANGAKFKYCKYGRYLNFANK